MLIATDAKVNSLTPQYSNDTVERMYVRWDAALSNNTNSQVAPNEW
jgi:hypothetical protein